MPVTRVLMADDGGGIALGNQDTLDGTAPIGDNDPPQYQGDAQYSVPAAPDVPRSDPPAPIGILDQPDSPFIADGIMRIPPSKKAEDFIQQHQPQPPAILIGGAAPGVLIDPIPLLGGEMVSRPFVPPPNDPPASAGPSLKTGIIPTDSGGVVQRLDIPNLKFQGPIVSPWRTVGIVAVIVAAVAAGFVAFKGARHG